jgi:hypothetical protein
LVTWIIKQAVGIWDHIIIIFLQQTNKKSLHLFLNFPFFFNTRNGKRPDIYYPTIYSLLVLIKQPLPDHHSEENKDVVKQKRLIAVLVLETLFVKLVLLPNPIPFVDI